MRDPTRKEIETDVKEETSVLISEAKAEEQASSGLLATQPENPTLIEQQKEKQTSTLVRQEVEQETSVELVLIKQWFKDWRK